MSDYDDDYSSDAEDNLNANPFGPEEFGSPDPTPQNSSSRRNRGSGHAPDDEWNSDEALNSLKMERSVNPTESNKAMTQRLFEEAAPGAAMALTHLALHATNENTRLNAAKYVTERILGKVGDSEGDSESSLDEMVREFHTILQGND
jgi:hypothetical protein